jgi:hypothetical protein
MSSFDVDRQRKGRVEGGLIFEAVERKNNRKRNKKKGCCICSEKVAMTVDGRKYCNVHSITLFTF